MWGGAHPQDLRIELVDAKNHWYTIHKNVRRQIDNGSDVPVKYLKALTHNIFDYGDARDFRRETMQGVVAAARGSMRKAGLHARPGDSGGNRRNLSGGGSPSRTRPAAGPGHKGTRRVDGRRGAAGR